MVRNALITLQDLGTFCIKGLRPLEQQIPLSSFLTLNRQSKLTVIRHKMHDKSPIKGVCITAHVK